MGRSYSYLDTAGRLIEVESGNDGADWWAARGTCEPPPMVIWHPTRWQLFCRRVRRWLGGR